jgi:hypothetical protein
MVWYPRMRSRGDSIAPRHSAGQEPHARFPSSLCISSGCVRRRSTGAFERFGLFSGQVFARPLRNQPAHCPAGTIQPRRRNPDARRNPGVIVRPRAARLVGPTTCFRRNFRKFNSDAGARPVTPSATIPISLSPRIKWRTVVTRWRLCNIYLIVAERQS